MDKPSHEPPLDELPCGLATASADGRVLWANSLFCEWACRPREAVVGARLRDLLSPSNRARWDMEWHGALEWSGQLPECQCELEGPDGEQSPVSLSARAVEADGVKVFRIALLPARERGLRERELHDTQAELRLLVHEATRVEEDAKDRALFAEQMVGIVSHDLRNPLAAIHMGALALSKGELSSNQARVLGRLSRSAARATRLIADLLDFTAARVGRGLSVAPRPMDLREVVADAVEELSLAFPGRRLEHVHEGDGRCVADADRVSQLVGNLVANAMAYGDPAREVVVSTSSEPGRVRVSVRNWGRPIPPEAVEELFQPMVRGDAGGSERSVGLGLYIVSEIAKAHGGSASARSSVEEGTRFDAVFPVRGPAPAPSAPSAPVAS